MNKRIKELYGNALDKAVPYTWHNLDHAEVKKIMKEFAELIVEECLYIVEGEDDGSADTKSVRLAMIRMKQHFGVKE